MGIRAHLADTLVAASGGLAQDVEAVHGVGLPRHHQGQGPGEGHPLLGAGGLIQDGGGDEGSRDFRLRGRLGLQFGKLWGPGIIVDGHTIRVSEVVSLVNGLPLGLCAGVIDVLQTGITKGLDHVCHAGRDIDALQAGTSVKAIRQFSHSVRDIHTDQARAVPKGMFSEVIAGFVHGLGQPGGFQGGTAQEGVHIDHVHAVGDVDALQSSSQKGAI